MTTYFVFEDLVKYIANNGTRKRLRPVFKTDDFCLYKEGKISYENAIAYADSANDLRLRVKTEGLEDVKEGKTASFKLKQ